jgi:hypothetical protein
MSDDYEVGYGRPPKHTQFKKGQSGHPSGRPKGTKNLKTDLLEELGELVLVREGERSIRISKQRAVLKSLVARTLKGDGRAATALLSLFFRVLDLGDNGLDQGEDLAVEEREVWDLIEARVERRLATQSDTEPATGAEEPTR